MSGRMYTTCHWGHLVDGLRNTSLLKNIIKGGDTIQEIIFTLPSGEKITIPQDSKLELTIGVDIDTYCIGIEHGPEEFDMPHGPTPNLSEMLKVPPPDSRAKIFRFHPDGSSMITHVVCSAGIGWKAIRIGPEGLLLTDPE